MENLMQYWTGDERDSGSSNSNTDDYHPIRLSKNTDDQFSVNMDGRALIGKVFHCTPLREAEVRKKVRGMWAEFCPVLISEVAPNIFMFLFEEKQHAAVILSRGPWFVMHYLLSLCMWDPVKPMNAYCFDFVSFWIQIYGVPRAYVNTLSVKAIAGKIGTLIEIGNPVGVGSMSRNFHRAKVVVNVANPLKVGCWVDLDEETMMWVNFKYEQLMEVCYKCGRIDHTQSDCQHLQTMIGFEPNQPKFGSFLFAQSPNQQSQTMHHTGLRSKEDEHPRQEFNGDLSGTRKCIRSREVGSGSIDVVDKWKDKLNGTHVLETPAVLATQQSYLITEGISAKEGLGNCKEHRGGSPSKTGSWEAGLVEVRKKAMSPIRETWYDAEGNPVCVTVNSEKGEQTFIFDEEGRLKPLSS